MEVKCLSVIRSPCLLLAYHELFYGTSIYRNIKSPDRSVLANLREWSSYHYASELFEIVHITFVCIVVHMFHIYMQDNVFFSEKCSIDVIKVAYATLRYSYRALWLFVRIGLTILHMLLRKMLNVIHVVGYI